MNNDLISRQEAIELCDWYEHEFSECEYAIRPIADDIKKLPSAEPNGRLEQAISGKTAEEVYEILHWLMYQYAKQYTDSRDAVIEWLKWEDVRGEQNE